jgi:hypothetical protein
MVSHPHIAKVRAELEKSGDVETLPRRIDTKGRKQPATRRIAKPKPESKTFESVVEVGASAEASAEQRKQEYAVAEHKAVNAKDIALDEFTGHVLRLLQMTNKAKPERFAKTSVDALDLSQLACFLTEVAAAHEAPPMSEAAQ